MSEARAGFILVAFIGACGGAIPGQPHSVGAEDEAIDGADIRPNAEHGMRQGDEGDDNRDDGNRGGPGGRAGGAAGSSTIRYHGGPIITGTINVYYIWYGNWTGNTATTVLTTLAKSIGGSPYFNINTTYTNNSGGKVANSVNYAGSINDAYSAGTILSDAGIFSVVRRAITNGLPLDKNAVYFVLTSKDVGESSGFCSQYCGWHTHGTISNTDIKYAFIGNPDRCPSACEAQKTGPNNNAGADGMASIISHELDESATDPDLNAWYDGTGAENADKCAWTFGTTYRVANGAVANMNLGGLDFLIQRNWLNVNAGSCALSY